MAVADSFAAVRKFQDIRKKTDSRGNIGDDVTALVKGPRNYKLITGIVVKYRSDAGRYVLDTDGNEWSVDGSDVRKYVETAKDNQAHENYLTIEHFALLKDNEDFVQRESDSFILRAVGVAVAVLVDVDDKPTIKYGIISDSFHGNNGSRYHVMHRDGTKSQYVSYDHTALI